MQFTKLISSAAFVASVFGKSIMLYANDVNEVLFNHAGISGRHEGAGIDYLTVGSSAEALEYDEATGRIYQDFPATDNHDEFRLYLSVFENTRGYQGFPFLQLSSKEPTAKWSLNEHSVLQYEGSDNDKFYAALDVSDPYNTKDTWFVGYGYEAVFVNKVSNLTPIYIKVDEVAVL